MSRGRASSGSGPGPNIGGYVIAAANESCDRIAAANESCDRIAAGAPASFDHSRVYAGLEFALSAGRGDPARAADAARFARTLVEAEGSLVPHRTRPDFLHNLHILLSAVRYGLALDGGWDHLFESLGRDFGPLARAVDWAYGAGNFGHVIAPTLRSVLLWRADSPRKSAALAAIDAASGPER